MSDTLKAAWTEFRTFADAHRRLMLGVGAFIAGFIVGKIT